MPGSTPASTTADVADGIEVQAALAGGRVARLRERSVARELASFARRNPLAVAGGLVGLLIVIMAITAPLIAPADPLKTDFRRMSKPPDARSFFGTDQVGRDTLSRVIHGARSSLIVAFASVLLGTTMGALWGVASGAAPGCLDRVTLPHTK
jgi:ABC-type dipeptide/oligopeptide/nickel transport system permease subunit